MPEIVISKCRIELVVNNKRTSAQFIILEPKFGGMPWKACLATKGGLGPRVRAFEVAWMTPEQAVAYESALQMASKWAREPVEEVQSHG